MNGVEYLQTSETKTELSKYIDIPSPFSAYSNVSSTSFVSFASDLLSQQKA